MYINFLTVRVNENLLLDGLRQRCADAVEERYTPVTLGHMICLQSEYSAVAPSKFYTKIQTFYTEDEWATILIWHLIQRLRIFLQYILYTHIKLRYMHK